MTLGAKTATDKTDGGATNEAVADLRKALLAEHRPVQNSGMEPPRALSLPVIPNVLGGHDSFAQLKQPGGFRRGYLHTVADTEGKPMDERPNQWSTSLVKNLEPLVHEGYFEGILGPMIRAGGINESGLHVKPSVGTAGTVGTTMALLKSFVGSGITFMPGAFCNGGWILSTVMMVFLGLLNAYCIWLLLQCSKKLKAMDYGEIASTAGGRVGELLVQASLVMAQFGTVIAFVIFLVKNAVSLDMGNPDTIVMVLVPILIPLCLIRKLEWLEIPNLLADVLIILGLMVICGFESNIILDGRAAYGEMQPYKLDTFALFFGTSMQALEGIPVILPIRNSMKDPQNFERIFAFTFSGIVVLYIAFALMGYIAFGSEVQTPVILNLPPGNMVNGIKIFYMLALVLSIPLFFVPVARITELWVFGIQEGGTKKWSKNALRTLEIIIFGVVAICCGPNFEKFLGLIGGICATPLAFVYPALFHLIVCADTALAKVLDVLILTFGVASVIFVVWQTATT